jgi:hypothetical protein
MAQCNLGRLTGRLSVLEVYYDLVYVAAMVGSRSRRDRARSTTSARIIDLAGSNASG